MSHLSCKRNSLNPAACSILAMFATAWKEEWLVLMKLSRLSPSSLGVKSFILLLILRFVRNQFRVQVGAQGAGALQGLLFSPFLNVRLMPAEEYVWHFPSVILRRPCVYWRGEEAVLERVRQGRLLI